MVTIKTKIYFKMKDVLLEETGNIKPWILQCQNLLDRIFEDKNHFCLNEKAIISTSVFHQDITISN